MTLESQSRKSQSNSDVEAAIVITLDQADSTGNRATFGGVG
jgi:hypothetical protein